jgi:hypothetical protein
MRLSVVIATIFLVTILGTQSKPQEGQHGALSSGQVNAGTALIAPSVSTSIMARRILAEMYLSEVPLKRADRVLVVVRSSLSDPLNYSYETVCELRTDAESQLNIAGPKYHIYIYSMDDELRASELSHKSFAADND